MLKILIFGTGESMHKIIKNINYEEVAIIAYIDNNSIKIGKKLNGIEIINPNEINNYEYDFIIIASTYYNEITQQLMALGIDCNKIVQFYNYTFLLPNTFFFNDIIVENNNLSKIFLSVYAARVLR